MLAESSQILEFNRLIFAVTQRACEG